MPMSQEDFDRARTEADDDLAVIEAAGIDPGTLENMLAAERDRYSDLDCDFGDGLIYELRDFTDG